MRQIAGACLCVVVAVVAGACGGNTEDAAGGAERAPSPSSGCAKSDRLARSGTVSLSHDGMDRSYDIVVPETGAGEPMPLVLGYHGFGGSPYELSVRLADRAMLDGFVAVFPRGSTLAGSDQAYFNVETVDEPLLADDIGFTGALLDRVEAGLCIDRARIYAIGMSNGGMFVSTLACKLGDRIAAIAPVAAVHVPPDCTGRPIPILVTHGTSDPLVPFEEADVGQLDVGGLIQETAGGPALLRMFEEVIETPVTSWVESWARHNGCSLDTPAVTRVGETVERTAYSGCDSGGDVVLQAIEGGGHDWPTSPTLDATAQALAFFREHTLPEDGER
jgi:polyhydroxybutyrate depolymerase